MPVNGISKYLNLILICVVPPENEVVPRWLQKIQQPEIQTFLHFLKNYFSKKAS